VVILDIWDWSILQNMPSKEDLFTRVCVYILVVLLGNSYGGNILGLGGNDAIYVCMERKQKVGEHLKGLLNPGTSFSISGCINKHR